MKLRTLLLAVSLPLASQTQAQNAFPSSGSAGVGTNSPATSSLLEVRSTTKGVLIPRMTNGQRNSIVSPAQGLLIYQTDGSKGFYAYDGSWKAVSPATSGFATKKLNNLTSPTAVGVDLNPGTTNTMSLGSDSSAWKDLYLTGSLKLGGNRFIHKTGGANNVFVGTLAGNAITTGMSNTANGYKALFSNTTGYSNTAVGDSALYANTTGAGNIAIGLQTLANNKTGIGNTALGNLALYSDTASSWNTGIGYQSLFYNTSGHDNTATGFNALVFNSTGYNNTAVGNSALSGNTEGYNNTGLGFQALYSNKGGDILSISSNRNTGVGYQALYSNSTGSLNTSIGTSALFSNTVGRGNIAIGANSDVTAGNLVNAIAVGTNVKVDASNKVRIGDINITSIGGQVGWTTFSDGRFKKNIKQNVKGLDFIKSLNPITYTLDLPALNEYSNKGQDVANLEIDDRTTAGMKKSEKDAEEIVYSGFIAQEVDKAAERLDYQFSGVDKPKAKDGLYGLRYSDFVVPMVKAIQELDSINSQLRKENIEIRERLNNLEAVYGNISNHAPIAGPGHLDQNKPNPVSGTTIIHYYIPVTATSARLSVTNLNGQLIKAITITKRESGHLNLQTAALPPGIYNYSLWVDGKQVDTKQLIIMK